MAVRPGSLQPPAEGALRDVEPARPAMAREAQQRWRVTYTHVASESAPLHGRDYAGAWEAALEGTGLPVARSDAGRLRVALGAALPTGVDGHAELVELWLTERLPRWRVGDALRAMSLLDDHRIVDLEDVWLGAPALAGRIAAADYAIELATAVDHDRLEAAVRDMLAAPSLPRERRKGAGVRAYDLRPLLAAAELAQPGPPAVLRIRTRIHPELGTGRYDEVLAALGEILGEPLEAGRVTRERLLLADDPVLLADDPPLGG